MRLTTSENHQVIYFAKYDQFMLKLFPKMHFSSITVLDILQRIS